MALVPFSPLEDSGVAIVISSKSKGSVGRRAVPDTERLSSVATRGEDLG